MKPLALGRLPDRNPVKRTIICEPDLNKALEDYAQLYRETYGETDSVDTLVPFMLSSFLAKDRAFTAFRRARAGQTDAPLRHGPIDEAHRKRGRPSAVSEDGTQHS